MMVSLVRVRVQRTDDVLEVCPTILTEDSMQAQHLAATLALYNLVKGQVRCPEDPEVSSYDACTHTFFFLFVFLVSAPASASNLQRCLAGVERQRAAEGGREPHGCQQTSGPVHLPASDETQAAAEPEPPAGITLPRPDGAEQEWR